MATDQTVAEIDARLVEVRAAITKARTAQAYQAGGGQGVTRGNLQALLEEEKWLLEQRSQAAAAESATSSGGSSYFSNKVQFERPR